MNKFFALIVALVALAFSAAAVGAQGNHEYAPLEEKVINYKDWTFKSLSDDKPVNLRQWAQGKRLVMVVYFAPWCPNWTNEAPIAAKLYDKYKLQGFDVVGVSEYGTRDEVRQFFGEKGAPYTVVTESEARDQRDKTSHYTVRQASGDTRRWGSPYNVFLEPSKLTKDGDLLTEKAWVVNGELIEAEADKFIRERLGLDKKAQLGLDKTQIGTPCEQ
ncbi:MAG TPA: TlpA disulfide reductase family protein [Pyrinomonadaceae bacterium]|jgi:peroxiredoxin